MEIKKYICLLVFVLSFLSCKKEPTLQRKHLPSTSREAKNYQFISYKNRTLTDNNKINIFEYNDTKISIEYNKYTFFGYETKQFNLYQSSYDLDSGELNLLRYDDIDTKNQIFLVELNDYSFRTYHIYTYQNNSLYYLGENNIDLSKMLKTSILILRSNRLIIIFQLNPK